MRLKMVVWLVVLAATSAAFASDPQVAMNGKMNFVGDSGMILPASGEQVRTESAGNDRACYTMRTYRIRKDLDRESVIQVKPDEVAFDPDNIIGCSTCQRAGKFAVKSTQ